MSDQSGKDHSGTPRGPRITKLHMKSNPGLKLFPLHYFTTVPHIPHCVTHHAQLRNIRVFWRFWGCSVPSFKLAVYKKTYNTHVEYGACALVYIFLTLWLSVNLLSFLSTVSNLKFLTTQRFCFDKVVLGPSACFYAWYYQVPFISFNGTTRFDFSYCMQKQ